MPHAAKLTDDGDLSYKAGSLERVEGLTATIQAVRVGVSTVKGENLFHPTLGIDLTALGGRSRAEIAAMVEAALLRTRRIRRVIDTAVLEGPTKKKGYRVAVRAILTSGEEVSVELEAGS